MKPLFSGLVVLLDLFTIFVIAVFSIDEIKNKDKYDNLTKKERIYDLISCCLVLFGSLYLIIVIE